MSNNIVLVSMIFGLLISIIFLYQLLRRLWLSVGLESKSQPNERTSQPATRKPIRLKLLIDKNRSRVVFAECGKDFVDVLLSFLILPMGTIIRLANKESRIGSMDELYKSVEALDKKCFRTKACKNMLLQLRSAHGLQSNKLIVKIDGMDYTKFYTCSKTPCLNNESFGFISLVENSICACGKPMDNKLRIKYADGKADGGFITRAQRFIISNDLQILPASISNTRSLLLRHEFRDNTGVQEQHINIGLEEVLQLLHQSMLSKTPLTDVFLQENMSMDITSSPDSLHLPYQQQMNGNSDSEEMNVKLWFSKSTNRVICIEAREDFVDFLFSFLTIPLGSINKLLRGDSCIGSIDNLYKSVQMLSAMDIISLRCKEMLLSPKLEHMFGCENRLLEVEEEVTPSEFIYNKCYSCSLQKKTCLHLQFQRLKIMNPKWRGTTKGGGGFIREQGSFLVTDNLMVETLSPASGMSRLDIPFTDLEELSVTVGKEEALTLLRGALTSKSVLNHAFSSRVIDRNLLYYS
ncbi:uncharacterized protein LOC21401092 [Morus notabilis]|nr:uncharacterized protein LOC21401092 [Morus notabilis]